MSWVPVRELPLRFQIDTNRVNGRGRLECMNRLEQWNRGGLIELLMPEPAYGEALAGANPVRTRKAMQYIQSFTTAETMDEISRLRQIERILFPDGAQNDGQRNDVEIVFNADKYGARLITADGGSKRQPGGILGAASALAAIDIHVLSDCDACTLVLSEIDRRDRRARDWAQRAGRPLPDWVGQDA